MTQAQLLQFAQTIAKQQQSPDRQDLLNQQTQAGQQAQAQQQLIAGLYGAAAKESRSVGPTIGQTYSQEADRQATFAKGYSDAMKANENQSADQLNQTLGKWGNAPTVQGDKGAADVLYGLGGAIPASTLSSQGAAFKSAADFLPTTTLLRGADAVSTNQAAASKTHQDFANQIAKLDAQIPGLAWQVYQGLANQQTAEASQQTSRRAADVNRAIAIWQAAGKVTPEVSKLLGIPAGTPTLSAQNAAREAQNQNFNQQATKVRLTIAQQQANTAEIRAQNTQANSDRNYKLALKKLGIQQQKLANPKLTPYQYSTLSAKAEKDLENFYYGVPAKTRADGSVMTPQKDPVQYRQAVKILQRRYPGLGTAQVLTIANTLYQPGEGGRPLLTPQQQQAVDTAVASWGTSLKKLTGGR